MVGVFINYRAGHDAYAAQLIDEKLCAEFGEDNVFRDKRALRPGTHFPPELWRRLEASSVLLALIGPNWLTMQDGAGKLRLDNPDDYVRAEIRQALEHMVVIPVLLDAARLPQADVLPHDIKGLAIRQYMELRSRDSGSDLQRIADEVARHVPRQDAGPPGSHSTGSSTTAHFNNQGASSIGPQIVGSTVRDVITTTYATPPRDYRAEGNALFGQGSYHEAAARFRQVLADPGADPEVHFYLALALLGGRPPRDHANVSEIVRHLGMAKAFVPARLLWLVVEEDHHASRRRSLEPPPLMHSLVDELRPAQAREIVSQFRAVNSPTWQALARRAQQT